MRSYTILFTPPRQMSLTWTSVLMQLLNRTLLTNSGNWQQNLEPEQLLETQHKAW